jgi:hypothetical protein
LGETRKIALEQARINMFDDTAPSVARSIEGGGRLLLIMRRSAWPPNPQHVLSRKLRGDRPSSDQTSTDLVERMPITRRSRVPGHSARLTRRRRSPATRSDNAVFADPTTAQCHKSAI